MLKLTHQEMEAVLISARESILKNAKKVFKSNAIEAHIFGSVARNDADAYSDLDIWFTFEDSNFSEIIENRFEYYNNIGTIIHACEAPQNAPIGGIHAALIVEMEPGYLTMVDIYLCPLSTSYITDEAKKLFGIDLPQGTIAFNPQKIQVAEDYRINFFICFVFNTIKKIIRKSEHPLEGVIREYNNLRNNYGFNVETLVNETHDISTLEEIIKNTQTVANNKQKVVLGKILEFSKDIIDIN